VLENWPLPKTGNEISDRISGDGSKATFTILPMTDRVDFRLLIKDFAKEFSTRVE
jgi:hypothetical protein